MDTSGRAKSRELTAEQYLHDILRWRDQQSKSSPGSLQHGSEGSCDANLGTIRHEHTREKTEGFHDYTGLTEAVSISNLSQSGPVGADSHTYDKAAQKWTEFDVEADLADLSNEDTQNATPPTRPHSLNAKDQQGAPLTANVTLQSGSGQQSKLQAITSRRIVSMTAGPPKTMSHFSFSQATGSEQQQVKEKSSHPEDKSKALPDHRSTDVNGAHSKPTGPEDAEANREESAFWKDKGNMAFKAQKWEVAAEAYSRSIEAEASCVGYANRAMARLKAGDAAAAEQDCSSALELDATYLKAWLRRSSARKLLGRRLEAIDDLEQALRLEPASKSMAADLKALIAEHEAASPLHLPTVTMAVQSEGAQRRLPAEQPKPSARPEAEPRQAQTGRQTEAKAVHGGPAASNADVRVQTLQLPASQSTQNQLSEVGPIGATADSKSEAERSLLCMGEEASPALTQKEQHSGASPRAEQTSTAESPQGKAAAGAYAASTQGSFLGKALSGASAKARLPEGTQLSTSQAQQIADAAAAGTQMQRHVGNQLGNGTGQHPSKAAVAAFSASKGSTARSLQPPKTSSEFEKVWKSLSGDPAGQGAYLKLLQDTPLDKLLKHSLTGSVLSSVLSCLLTRVTQVDEDLAVSLLKAMPNVPRFEMTMMCLSAKDKAALCSAWNDAASKTDNARLQADMFALKKVYKL